MPTRPVPKGIPLALGCDEEQLTEFQILIRHQLEIFEAGPEDVENNTQGRKKHIKVGQVGLRCKHCSSLPIRARGRGAVYYPSKLKHVYQGTLLAFYLYNMIFYSIMHSLIYTQIYLHSRTKYGGLAFNCGLSTFTSGR